MSEHERINETIFSLGMPAEPARRNEPRPGTYIVIRVAPDYSHRVPADLDGKWYDLADIPSWVGGPSNSSCGPGVATMHETGRFEIRDDGAVAQVWELRP